MSIRTLDLQEAASFLKMTPSALRRKAANGEVPGAKPGKCWCFREDDLAEYLRSLYASPAKVSWGDHDRRSLCHSTNETMFGGLTSATKEKEYENQLGLQTK